MYLVDLVGGLASVIFSSGCIAGLLARDDVPFAWVVMTAAAFAFGATLMLLGVGAFR